MECPNCESGEFALRSVEQYPTRSVGPLPHFVVNYAQELRPVDARFIAANSPAVVLRQVERDLAVIKRHQPYHMNPPVACVECSRGRWDVPWPCIEVRELAHAYAIPTEDGTT